MLLRFIGKRAFSAVLSQLDGKIDVGELRLTLPDGTTRLITGRAHGPTASLEIKSYNIMFRLLRFGSLGFAEAYLADECDSPDMRAVLNFTLANARWFDSGAFESKGIGRWVMNRLHAGNDNTREGSRKNISYHYDLGNDFYGLWLDKTMTYSSAVFENGQASFETAQNEKYRRLAELVNLKKGDRVIEVGCGWGGFAEFAAREYGAHVTGLTISQEQLDFAKDRLEKAGLSDLTDMQFCDYREHEGRDYDALVSIEMFEAVGEAHWQSYFAQAQKFLKPGGKAGLQIITIAEDQFEAYQRSPDFIQKYIFPGGMLPTPTQLRDLASGVKMTVEAMNAFREDYARTLDTWLESFRENWDKIEALPRPTHPFDERFKRMWEYYLHYCAAGFMDGRIDVKQIGLAKP